MSDKDEKSATTPTGTAHWSLGLNAPTLWHSGSLINWCTLMYMKIYNVWQLYKSLFRLRKAYINRIIRFKGKIAPSVNFSQTFTFSDVTTLRSIEPDCAEVPIDTLFWQLPSFVIFITSLHCFLFLLLEKRRDTKIRHAFPVALSSIMCDADEFRMAVNTDHTRNPLKSKRIMFLFLIFGCKIHMLYIHNLCTVFYF